MVTTWKNFHFILTKKSDFYVVDNCSVTAHALLMCMLTSLSVDEILQVSYRNWSTNFTGLPFYKEMVPY